MQIFELFLPEQVRWQSKFNLGILAVKNSPEEVSRTTYESSQTRNECPSANGSNFHRSEVGAVMNQYSDDSDSEIFRVKRRPSKVDKRCMNDVTSSTHTEHQVLFVAFSA